MMVCSAEFGSLGEALLPKSADPERRPVPVPVPGRGGSVGVDVLFFDLVPLCLGEGTADEWLVERDGLREFDLAGLAGASESISMAVKGTIGAGGGGVGGFTVGVGIGGTERGESTWVADFGGCWMNACCCGEMWGLETEVDDDGRLEVVAVVAG